MLLYIDDSKNCTQKLLELINEFSKVERYKINIWQSVSFLYTKWNIDRECKKIPFKIASKIKLPRKKPNQVDQEY